MLVTPLGLDVQADAPSGQVRATVKDVVADRYQGGVEVKVIGSVNEDFVSGTSDPRGVFVAEGIRGAATVIAELPPGRYAIFRSPLPRQGGETFERGVLSLRGKGPQTVESPIAVAAKTGPKPEPSPSAAQPEVEPAAIAEMPTGMDIGDSPARKQIRAALRESTELDFTETPLEDVIGYVKDHHKIQVQFDQKALEEGGVATDKQVTIHVRDVPLRSALRLLLRPESLTYVVQDDVLLITTPEEAGNRLLTKVYPVGDLILPPGTPEDGDEANMADFDSLIELISATVQPTTWDAVGGSGTIAPFDTNLSLVLSQTEEVHDEIDNLLETLRSVKTGKGGASPGRRASAPPRSQGKGMGGGMGGMATFGGGASAGKSSRGRSSTSSVTPLDPNSDLLGGVQKANEGVQRKHVDRLKGMYQGGMGGMGGVGAGAAF